MLSLTRVPSELLARGPGPQAVRRLLTELMDLEDVSRLLAEKITGIGVRYDVGDAPALLGRRLRDLPCLGDASTSSVAQAAGSCSTRPASCP